MRAASRVLFLTVFIDLLGYGIVVPILAYSSKQYGANGMTLGLILGSFSLMQFFFSPIWGRLSDRIGRKPIIVGSLCGNVAGFLMFAFASNIAMLCASRVITGIAAASIPAAQAAISDSTDQTNRAKGMAMISLAFGLGIVLGPPLGGILSSYGTDLGVSPNLIPGAAASGLSVLALVMAIFLLPESHANRTKKAADEEAWTIFFRTPELRLGTSALAVLMCALASLSPILVFAGRDRFGLSARDVGSLLGLMGVMVILLQFTAVHRLAKRFGDPGAAMIGAGGLMLGLLLVPFTSARSGLIVATCLMGVGQGLVNPTLSAYISKVAPPSHRGGILGITASITALARVLGPPFAGFAYDAFRTPGAFFSQAVIVIVGMTLAMRLTTPRAASTPG